jgi:hypothetical protein
LEPGSSALAESSDTRLLVIESELSSTLARKKREGNSLAAVLRQAFDGTDLRVLTKESKGRVAHDPHVSLIAHISGRELRKYLEAVDIASGFWNRFCFVRVARSQLLPDARGIPLELLQSELRRLNEGIGFARHVEQIWRSEDARSTWAKLYEEFSLGDLGGLSARGPAIVSRIAAIFAVLDQSRLIEVPHLSAAAACWRYCLASARSTFGDDVGLSPLARRLRAAICVAGTSGCSRSELRHASGSNDIPADRIHAALDELHDAGLAVMDREPSDGGRPREVWYDAAVKLRRPSAHTGEKGE